MNKNKSHSITVYIIIANILVFITLHLTNFLIADNWFLYHFAKITPKISIDKEYYRLFTAVFTHASISHILFNCYALYFLGRPIEYLFGKLKFLIIFLVSGLFGTLFSFIFSSSISIGASGGVFGLFGVHIYLYLKNKEVYMKIFQKEIFILLIINLGIGFIAPNIDYFGHIGGLLGGFLASLSVGIGKTKKENIIILLATACIFIGSFTYFNVKYVEYDKTLTMIINKVNISLQSGDYEEVKKYKEEIQAKKPLLPPTPTSDYIIDQIDEILDENS